MSNPLPSNPELRTVRLNLRLTPSEHYQLLQLASERGTTVSAILVSAVLSTHKTRLEARLDSLETRYSQVLYQLSVLKNKK